jgi:hypothetical protein
MIRTLTLHALLLTGPTSLFAQGPQRFELRAPQPLLGEVLKRAESVVLELDRSATMIVQDDRMRVVSPAGLDAQVVIAGMQAAGLGTFSRTGAVARKHNPFPQRVDTGDPAADDARYEADKQAWITANTDAYRALTGDGPLPGKDQPYSPGDE